MAPQQYHTAPRASKGRKRGAIYEDGPVATGKCFATHAEWRAACPGMPMVVVDNGDADYMPHRPCDSLWHKCAADPQLLRLVGGPPINAQRAPWYDACAFTTYPWLSHTRSGRPALVARTRRTTARAAR